MPVVMQNGFKILFLILEVLVKARIHPFHICTHYTKYTYVSQLYLKLSTRQRIKHHHLILLCIHYKIF